MSNKREVNVVGLIVGLLLSPAVAGLVGGFLLLLGLLPVIFGDSGGDLTGIAAITAIAIFVSVSFSYFAGSPVILAAWAIVHFLTTRKPGHFLIWLAIAGVGLSYVLYGSFLRQIDPHNDLSEVFYAVGPIITGSVSGACVGAMLSLMGYKTSEPHEL